MINAKYGLYQPYTDVYIISNAYGMINIIPIRRVRLLMAEFICSHDNHPFKCVQWVILLGGALGRLFGGSPHFLFVFYRPYRRENFRSESRMVSPTYKRTL